jgi:hypothetical protein
MDTWQYNSRLIILPEDDLRISQWDETRDQDESWIEEAELIAVRAYKMVLEDGPEICTSESSGDNSDHGEEVRGMYTPGVMSLSEARMTEERAQRFTKNG